MKNTAVHSQQRGYLNLRRVRQFAWAVAIGSGVCAATLTAAHASPPAMAISGTPVVDDLGQFNYTIPIAVPPGTAGMVPHLALTYRSSNLDGFEGYGWTLSGLDRITRCGQKFTADETMGGVHYNSNDAFCYNGQQLVNAPAAKYGASGVLDTQEASFYKVMPQGTQGGGPSWFKIYLKTGTILELGNTADSKIEAVGNASHTVREWLVNKITDVNGNYLTVTYIDDQANGQAYPIEVDYTGHGTTAPYNSVKFTYGSRSDTTPVYEGGSVQQMTVLLSDIVTYNGMPATGTPVLHYHLTYRPGTTQPGNVPVHSRLTMLTLCDGPTGAKCLAPMNFTWDGGKTTFAGLTSTTPTQVPIDFGNFDKDGLLDIEVGGCPTGGAIYTGTATPGSFVSAAMTATYYYYPPSGYTQTTWSGDACFGNLLNATSGTSVTTLDVNGDGLTDFLARTQFSSSPTDIETSVITNETGNSHVPNFVQTWTDRNTPAFQAIADFDNDESPDGLYQSDSYHGVLYFGKGIYGFEKSPDDTINGTGSSYTLVTGDFNGDGCAEIFAQGSPQTTIRLPYQHCGTPTDYIVVGDTNCNTGTIYAGDFNGDGKTDILAVPSTGSAYLCLSTGEGLAAGTPITSSSSWSAYKVVVGDWNGDGKADVALIGNGTNHLIYLSTGTDFYQVQSITNSATGVTGYVKDCNNDGADGLWLVKTTGTTQNVQYDSEYHPELLRIIDNGVGLTVTVLHGPLNQDGPFYHKGSQVLYPRVDIDGPYYVVSQVTFKNGSGTGYTNYNLTYNYSGGMADHTLPPTGAPKSNVLSTGLEAFTEIVSIDSRNGFRTVSDYFDEQSQFGILHSREVKSGTGSDINGEFYTYDGGFNYNIAGTILVSTKEVVRHDLNGAAFDGGSQVTEYDYDDYATVLDSTFTRGSGAGHKLTVDTNNNATPPTNDVPNWILNQINETDVESTLGSSDITRQTTFHHVAATGYIDHTYVEPSDTSLELITDYSYDGFGNQNQITQSGHDVASRHNNVDYDTTYGEFPITNTDPMAHASHATFDAGFGTPHTVTDVNNLTTTTYYDGLGRVTQIVRPDNNQIIYSYDYCSGVNGGTATCPTTAAYVVTMIPKNASNAQNGAKTLTYYDAFDRVVGADTDGFDGSTIRVSSQYDSTTGQLTATSRPYFLVGGTPQWTTYVRDGLFRVTQTNYPDGSQTSNCYNGETTSFTNAKGQTRTVVTNDQGLVASVTDGQTGTVTNCVATGGTTTTYSYDAFGNVLTVTDAASHAITNVYDTLGRKTDSTDPDMGHWTYSYDQLGELLTQTDAKHQTTSVQYDKLQRPTYRTEADLLTQWLWDPTNGIGKLQAACTPVPAYPASCPQANYQQQPSYDSLSRVSQGKLALDSISPAYNYNVSYNGDGRVQSLTYPSGFEADYYYNSTYGYLTSIKDHATGNVIWQGVTADAELHLTQQTLGGTITANDGYDPQTGRLLSTCATTHTGTCDGNVSNLSYGWDTVGNLLMRADANGPYTEHFCYDSLNRLLGLGASTLLCPSLGMKSFAYDSLGNITKKSDVCNTANCFSYGSGAGPHALTGIAGTYNGVTNPTFSYDANGNMTGGAGRTMTYTSYNMTASLSAGSANLAWAYGADHNRYKMCVPNCGSPTTTTNYLYDPATGGMSEAKIAGSTTTWTDYVQVPGVGLSIIRTQVGSGTPSFRYVLNDNLGSVSSVTDGVGSTPTVEHDSYDPWGKRRNSNGTDATCGTITSQTTRGYTGQEMLDSTSVCLVNMNARLYDPSIGRFMAADSVIPDALSTQSYNRYSYVQNNPLNATDPTGHVDCSEDPTHCNHTNDGSDYGYECFGCSGAGWDDMTNGGLGGYVADTAYSSTGTTADGAPIPLYGTWAEIHAAKAGLRDAHVELTVMWTGAVQMAGASSSPGQPSGTSAATPAHIIILDQSRTVSVGPTSVDGQYGYNYTLQLADQNGTPITACCYSVQEHIQGIEGVTSSNPKPVNTISGKFNDFVGVDRNTSGTTPDSNGHGAAYQTFSVDKVNVPLSSYNITTVLLHDIVVSKGVITTSDIIVRP